MKQIYFPILLLVALLLHLSALPQNEKKLSKNLQVFASDKFNLDYSITFDRKNPNKHGWPKVEEIFKDAFYTNGFKTIDSSSGISSSDLSRKYIIIIDYDYGYEIYAYRMQYSNLKGEIVSADNKSDVIGTFSYTGKYENDNVAMPIAIQLKNIALKNASIKPSSKPISNSTIKSKEDKLRELKDLLDKNLITQQDYDIQKAKILNE